MTSYTNFLGLLIVFLFSTLPSLFAYSSQVSIGYLHPSDEAKGKELSFSHQTKSKELMRSLFQVKYMSLSIDSDASSFEEKTWTALAITNPEKVWNYQLGAESSGVNSDYSRLGLSAGLHYNHDELGSLHFIGKWTRWGFVESSPSTEKPLLHAWTGNISADYDLFWPISLSLFYENSAFNRENVSNLDLASLTDPSAGEVYRISESAYGLGAAYISRNWSIGLDLYQSIQIVDGEVVNSYSIRGDYKIIKDILAYTSVGAESAYNLGFSYNF
jgi:hypothetical protein